MAVKGHRQDVSVREYTDIKVCWHDLNQMKAQYKYFRDKKENRLPVIQTAPDQMRIYTAFTAARYTKQKRRKKQTARNRFQNALKDIFLLRCKYRKLFPFFFLNVRASVILDVFKRQQTFVFQSKQRTSRST